MRKKLCLMGATLVFTAMASLMVHAGTWKSDAYGWWYDNGNGEQCRSCWQWIDGNGDGIAECYYFNENGYCLMNTSTPDGFTVASSGAWIVDGVIQTKSVPDKQNNSTATVSDKSSWKSLMGERAINGYVANEYAYNIRGKKVNAFWLQSDDKLVFALDKEFNELSFSYEPSNTMRDDVTFTITITDDDGNIIYEKDDADYKTKETVNVDVSGVTYLTIESLDNGHVNPNYIGYFANNYLIENLKAR